MSRTRLAFLLGGYAAFGASAEAFVSACGGADSRIALLFQNADREGRHYAEYAKPWREHGATEIALLGRDRDGHFDVEAALGELRAATGIFIGGGHTPTYYQLYAMEPLRSAILARHAEGVPFGGMSAGAMLAARYCVTRDGESGMLSVQAGLGIADELVAVHFTERGQLPTVLEQMAAAGVRRALGLDEATCVVFRDGVLHDVIGPPAHEITLESGTRRGHTVTSAICPGVDGRGIR